MNKYQKKIEKCKERISQIEQEIINLNAEKKEKINEIKSINDQEIIEYVKGLKMDMTDIIDGIEFAKLLKSNSISSADAREILFDEKPKKNNIEEETKNV